MGFSLEEKQLFALALSKVEYIGPIQVRLLSAYFGGIEGIFTAKKKDLEGLDGVGSVRVNNILKQRKQALLEAEKELVFAKKHNIKIRYFLEENYPSRLKQCNDAPIVLFSLGNLDFEQRKCVAIVGSRKATEYGKAVTEELVAGLAAHGCMIVSGLAYGIDIAAHRAAMKYNLPTLACLAHGLDRVYPAVHKQDVRKMMANGGVVTEFCSGTIPDRENFPKRNRIIAGLVDAVVVVEAQVTGGAIITANIAHSYNRDVFAVPGKIGDTYSEGCNRLIKTNRAAMVEHVQDLEYQMNWMPPKDKKKENTLMPKLSADEELIVGLLREKNRLHIDALGSDTGLTSGKLSGVLLSLELQGVLRSLPGKFYEVV